jgi:hypothetical protein
MREDGAMINGHTLIAHALEVRNIHTFNGSREWLLSLL